MSADASRSTPPSFEALLEEGDSRPVLLLDVDNVVNVRRHRWPDGYSRKRVVTSTGEEYAFTWSAMLVDRIRTLATSGTVTVVWASTWNSEADRLEALWDLPRLVRAWTAPIPHAQVPAVKHAAAAEVLGADRPLIWADDEFAGNVDEPGHLEICPNPKHGLTPAHLDRIHAFIARYQAH